jgi:hypothetical protein
MASETIYLKGKGKWAKLFEQNKDNNEDFHGPGGAYTLVLYLDKEELDKFAATGSRVSPKTDEDGVFLRLKRKHNHPSIEALGGPPQVVDADKNAWDPGVPIGNGSELEVAVTVYDTRMGKGTRLEGVRVLEHVELPPLENGEGSPRLPF